MLRLSTGAKVMSMTEVATDTVLCDGRGTISSDKGRVQDRAPIGIDNAGVDVGGVHSYLDRPSGPPIWSDGAQSLFLRMSKP